MAQQVAYHNSILSRLPPEEIELVSPKLQPITLARGTVLAEHRSLIENVFFLENGLGSFICVAPDGKKLQIAMFGSESLAPIAPAARSPHSLYECVMLTDGNGYRLDVKSLWHFMDSCPLLNAMLSRAILNLASQAALEALCAVTRSVELRVATWILMAHDRLQGDAFYITHETLALLLGIRRPSVTVAMHALEGKNLIKNERGRIFVRNRPGLLRFAKHTYGSPERELAVIASV